MKSFKTTLPLLFVSILSLTCNFVSAQHNKKYLIDSVIKTMHNRDQFTGSLLVIERGKVIYSNSLGRADIEKKLMNSSNSNFEIASVTKPFTALAIAILKQRGLVKYDELVTRYLPDFPYKTVTIRHLLTHTSGIQEYYGILQSKWDQSKVATNSDLLNLHKENHFELQFPQGERWEYSNTGYIFLALVIERVSKMPYDQFIFNNIFKPSGMVNSVVHTKADNNPVKNLANGYQHVHMLDTSYTLPDSIPYLHLLNYCAGGFSGDGKIYSSVNDLSRFAKDFFSNKFLSKKEMDEILRPVKLNNGTLAPANIISGIPGTYGLGWFIANDSTDGKVVLHTGGDWGYRSILIHNLKKDQTVILLDNRSSRGVFIGGLSILKILNDKPFNLPKRPLATVVAREILQSGIDSAIKKFNELKTDSQNYSISEGEFNDLGGTLNALKMLKEAVAICKLNTEMYPESWNVWDSYGEVLMNSGQKDLAINSYKKSLELNPENENGKKMLAELNK